VVLQPDAAFPDRLARLNEGPPHVGVLDQPLTVRDAAGLGIPDRSWRARFRYGDHEISVRRVLGRKPPAHLHPSRLHTAPGDGRIWPRQVDILEQATGPLCRSERMRPNTALIDGH